VQEHDRDPLPRLVGGERHAVAADGQLAHPARSSSREPSRTLGAWSST
jgi:hypothetical protein